MAGPVSPIWDRDLSCAGETHRLPKNLPLSNPFVLNSFAVRKEIEIYVFSKLDTFKNISNTFTFEEYILNVTTHTFNYKENRV